MKTLTLKIKPTISPKHIMMEIPESPYGRIKIDGKEVNLHEYSLTGTLSLLSKLYPACLFDICIESVADESAAVEDEVSDE